MNTFMCFDIEAYEHNKRHILEVGLTLLDMNDNSCSTRHFIVEENSHLRNGRYVSDNRDNFTHGTSEKIKLTELVELLDLLVLYTDGIVGHALTNDVKFLNGMGVQMHEDTVRYDTQSVAKEYFGEQRRLEVVYEHYCGKQLADAHNAGNDSHATGEIFLKQIELGLLVL